MTSTGLSYDDMMDIITVLGRLRKKSLLDPDEMQFMAMVLAKRRQAPVVVLSSDQLRDLIDLFARYTGRGCRSHLCRQLRSEFTSI